MAQHKALSQIVAEAADGLGPLPRPLQATLNITGRCNSTCQYCAYGDPATMGRRDLDFTHLTDRIMELARFGVRSLCLSGGEPMLRKDLDQLILLATSHGMTVTLITNGTLLSIESATRLHEARLTTLVLSLDSLRDDLYEQIRGVPLRRPRKAFQDLQRHRREKPCIPRIVINIVLTRAIADHLLSHVDELSPWMLGEDKIMVQAYQPPPGLPPEKDPLRFGHSDRQRLETLIDGLLDKQRQGAPVGNDPRFLRRLPGFLADGELPAGYRCQIGYSTLYIKENLDVHPCWQLPAVGNLAAQPLRAIWHSKDYTAARERMKALACRKCALICHTPEFLDVLADLVGYEPFSGK